MLTRKNDAPLDFDFDKVTEQSKDNPVFYVQYASARIHSVMRKAVEALMCVGSGPRRSVVGKPTGGTGDGCQTGRMAAFIEIAAKGHEPQPHRILPYDLASELHGLWNRGRTMRRCGFAVDNIPATQAKKK
jgi:arginyl-tRNA synthetase